MKYIETLRASALTQIPSVFFAELQAALSTKVSSLVDWLAFDADLFDLDTDDTVYLTRVELPVFELVSFSEQLDIATNVAADISQQYGTIYAVVGYDQETSVIIVYLASEPVTLVEIESLFDELDEETLPRSASVHSLSLVPTKTATEAPATPESAPSAPTAASGTDVIVSATPATLTLTDGGGVPEQPEDLADEPAPEFADEPFNEDMLTVDELAALDALRIDDTANAEVGKGLDTDAISGYEAFVQFNDISDFNMAVVYRVLALYEEYKHPTKAAGVTEVEHIFGSDEPDTFAEEIPDEFPLEAVAEPAPETAAPIEAATEAEPVRVAPLLQERAPDAAIAETEAEVVEDHKARLRGVLNEAAQLLPTDALFELVGDELQIVMTRSVENDNGVGSTDVDFNLRVTAFRALFAKVKEIDKFRLENNGELLTETGNIQGVIDYINSL